ncbi:helix-turn-helix transcriptional regulator [Chitinasiproducens palmae]|uniref:Regulatory protein, luxR family n=1 Tax=Chitinasiproducens palmae TaxID=1770053 RepID=A0A1H2PS03_9BURK|nr:helix-turn-helix transcriptional regulator [Chitinasiproducens palmae]SDV49717.1 regulatory protein, luxR family [Chitinasiproducens palmae]
MRYWTVGSRGTGSRSGELLLRLLDVIGAPGPQEFCDGVLDGLRDDIALDHCMAFHYPAHDAIRVVSGAGLRRDFAGFDNARPYIAQRLFRLDSNHPLLTDPQLREAGQVLVQHQSLDDVKLNAHRALYAGTDTAERLSVLHCLPDRSWLALNLYRPSSLGAFSPQEIAHLDDVAAPLARAAARHIALSAPSAPSASSGPAVAAPRPRSADARIAALEAALAGRQPPLPLRERQVMARLLCGMTADGIGADLGIASATVVTYKLRLFRRLGINTRAQLFARHFGG